MKVKHLDHLNMTVKDVDQTAEWYGRVFGFEVVEKGVQQDVRWAIIRAGDALLCIYEYPHLQALDSAELREKGIHGLNHFGLRIDDRAEFEQVIEREGLEFSYPSPVHWPHSTAWYVLDPTGYEIEVACWNEDRVAFGP